MLTHSSPALCQTSTCGIAPGLRLDHWESYNASFLVGLKCSTFADEGLLATQKNLVLGDIHIAEVHGNEHVIERTPQMVRQHPKDSVFVSLVLQSHSFFYQGRGCTQLEPGDLVIYDTRGAYLFGFTSAMRMLLLDIPADWFYHTCSRARLTRPLHVSGRSGNGKVLNKALFQLLRSALAQPNATSAPLLWQQAGELLRSMLTGEQSQSSALHATYLLAARRYIDDSLHDHQLDAERVAAAAGVSLRHLNRLLAPEGRTVTQLILERRLAHAAALLQRADTRRYAIGEIAWRCGFSSQAHFARTFRVQHGLTPTQMRSAAPGAMV